ncbi:MAG: M48 family metallopeptidase [Phototrophicaceae bacterium]
MTAPVSFLLSSRINRNTKVHQLHVNDIVVDVVRKDIKHLHLAVYPPVGRVRVAAPLGFDDEAVRLAVIDKLSWIKQQQQRYQDQARQTERRYVSGESHYFQGKRYQLSVVYADQPPSLRIRNKNTLELVVRPGSDVSQRERVISNWYRQALKASIPPLIAKWEPKMGVQVADWRIKQMKTKWGTCNIEAQRIWLNLELAKKSIECLEYIVVHEMTHLLERHHNERFMGLMDDFLPNWRLLRDSLNRDMLGHEHWEY